MIGYTLLGTSSLDKAGAYYDSLFDLLQAKRIMEIPDYFIAWATSPTAPSIGVTLPFNKKPATVGNGSMTAISLGSQEEVNAFYQKAIELGGTCEGKPGFRPHDATSGFYAGYFSYFRANLPW